MIRKHKTIPVFFITMIIVMICSCTTGPQPIKIGKDECVHCKMKIMDKRYGAELVTKKNKAYKFDSFECMIDYQKSGMIKTEDIELELVIDFNTPNDFISSEKVFYLVSKELPSPMGAYITAFSNHEDAKKAQRMYPGEIHSLKEVINYLDNRKNDLSDSSCCHEK